MPALDLRDLAGEISTARAHQELIERPTARDNTFDLNMAYKVSRLLLRDEEGKGAKIVGRKVGLTNRNQWPRLGLESVVWSYIYDNTMQYAQNNQATFSIAGMIAPKLETEIVFKLRSPLRRGTSDAMRVLQTVEWMALGFEIVDCHYPDWHFKPADMVADYGFHAGLIIGTPQPIGHSAILVELLRNFKVKLYEAEELVAEGNGSNVLDNPVLAVGSLAGNIAYQPEAEPLEAGEVISSGALTEPAPLTAGETWIARLTGLNMPPLSLTILE